MKMRTEAHVPLHGRPVVRQMRADDVDAIMALAREAFAGIPDERLWKPEQLHAHLARFPEGQWVVERDGGVVASCTNMLTTWERATRQHRWTEITAGGTLATHDPHGDTLYGTEIMVSPKARRMGLGRRLYERRYRFVVEHGLRGFATGGRLPGYRAHVDRMTPHEYIEKVKLGDLDDGTLTPQLKWGLTPIGLFAGYMMDPPSCHYASMVVWENPEYASRT